MDRDLLRARAGFLARVRSFFRDRDVLEVDTPVLGRGGISDPHLEPFATALEEPGRPPLPLYLQTSPEVFMKRMLAAGSGPIFQLARAFRNGEVGPHHNPEFLLLEWYRPGWSMAELAGEVVDLVREFLDLPPGGSRTYRELFEEGAGLDPHSADAPAHRAACARLGVDVPAGFAEDVDALQDLLLATRLGELLRGDGGPVVLTHYPAHRAALARPCEDAPQLAARFEVFVGGVELANGFEELTDPAEQARRFAALNRDRVAIGQPELPVDRRFLDCLGSMPPCAGVALGLDRLFMLVRGATRLEEVLPFPAARL